MSRINDLVISKLNLYNEMFTAGFARQKTDKTKCVS